MNPNAINHRSRRHFLTTLAAASGAVATTAFSAPEASSSVSFHEAARDLSLNTDADVIVCGAGPAGVTAAITAARAGTKVRLFEAHGSLGGVWTSSLLGYLLDFDKPGFNVELVHMLREREALHGQGMNGLSYQPEEMKLLLEELCAQAGVMVQLHTRVTAAYRDGRRLTTIVTESKSGRQAWRAPVFIDATGDGDLGALAGCEWETGETKGCPCQPMSMCVLLVVKDHTALKDFIHGAKSGSVEDTKRAFRAEIQRAGVTPSYMMPTLFPIRDNLLLAMMNHEYGILAFDAAKITEATMNARTELHRIVRGLRKLGGVWEGLQIVATPEQIGVRDGRRIRGRYVVSRGDLVAGARHDDAVVRATFPVDIHAYDKNHVGGGYTSTGVKVQPYDIPYLALIARDADGLLLAGRCISGDYIAHASYRVTGNAVAMGEAAGAAAALSARENTSPHDLPWGDIAALRDKTRRPA
ncbi:MAG: FAD-dependent oxidoreductase [Planctomycetota bacterium]|nr:FAD-dependent oxidoreductase [Planctomycetota bacterium]